MTAIPNRTRAGASGLALGLGLAAALGLGGCQEQEQQDIPNRVLDRPTDVTLICAENVCSDEDGDGIEQDDECVTQPLPLDVCERDSGSCSSDNPHLVGFVANSERNEIAMFTKCSNRLVDMDVESPGYNFIPAGILPTDLDASSDGCRVVSANVGSCDLTLLDAVSLARIGLGRGTDVDEPSELVANLIPQRFDPDVGRWVPLGARPGEVLTVPQSLTQAPEAEPGTTLEGVCDPRTPASVYISFPTCNLVAELDLRTGRVLQSRQFIGEEDGEVTVVDAGVTPVCPVECPAQFEDGQPDDLPFVDELGPFPQALELALEPASPSEDPDPNEPSSDTPGSGGYDNADAAVEGQRLYVGGLGSDILFEFPVADTGIWEPVENQLRLTDASGIKRVRVSPAVNAAAFGSDFSQFIYVVAGDGSTRVVGRALPGAEDEIGIECETQLDPNVVPAGGDLACIPVSEAPSEGAPAERRGFARGPGIRPPGGEEVSDWMFRKVYGGGEGSGPFAEVGTVAVGVTTGGRVVYAMINQQRASGSTTVETLVGQDVDPADIMDVRLFPHSLWPDPAFDTIEGLPLVQDEPPGRTLGPLPVGPTRYLSPTLRRIDATYVNDERAFAQLNVIGDLDDLGLVDDSVSADDNGLYEEDVPRVVVHDYRSWGGGTWSLEWEGTIPGTSSGTGQIYCANPGWEGGTCLVSEPDDARLLDASANFCDDGVLAGDKLVILGCRDDDDCGDGRRCLRETAAGGESSGICVSAQAYEERVQELRQVCANFIQDPCGEAYREFTITKAFQDELWIQSMDQPLISYLDSDLTPCEDGSNNTLVDGVCECLPGFSEDACAGEDDPEVVDCCAPEGVAPPPAPVYEARDRFVCAEEQPDGGCETDAECSTLLGDDEPWLCIDQRCRRPCEDADECVLRRLPGPACFSEFVTYQVALRNQFRVSGTQAGFISDHVEVDPDTGECRETQDPELSRLLTSRLPIPASDDPDEPDWLDIPVCVGDTVEPSNPNPCRITASRPGPRYHVFEYEGEEVSALRFSNPIFSLVLDLTSLELLTEDIPDYDERAWPAEFARFYRSRIPRGYRQEFRLEPGYQPFRPLLILEGRPVTLPMRIVPGPQDDVAYVVDGSGPGTSSSIRGQVVRVELDSVELIDNVFTGVR